MTISVPVLPTEKQFVFLLSNHRIYYHNLSFCPRGLFFSLRGESFVAKIHVRCPCAVFVLWSVFFEILVPELLKFIVITLGTNFIIILEENSAEHQTLDIDTQQDNGHVHLQSNISKLSKVRPYF